MDRLTRLCKNTENGKYIPYVAGSFTGIYPDCTLGEVVNRLAEYEDLEEAGRLIVLPCKEGTTIYKTCYKCICTLGHTYLHNTCDSPIECRKCDAVKIERWIRETTFSLSMLDRIGVDFFINREDAEAALSNI